MDRLVLLLCLLLPAVALAREHRIIGGTNANIANHPHQLSLRTSGHICGASLISATRAVTAAHCIGNAASSYSVLAGSTDRTVTTCSTCQLRTCNLARRHPNYNGNGNGFPNDIAVLGFSAINTNANIRYITLATSADGTFAGVTCTITGWGRTSSTSNAAPAILQQAQTTVITNTACTSTFGSSINSGHICIKSAGSNAGACNGDSGGPLVCNGKLAGATSFGVNNCYTNFASVYSRISYFNTWIKAQ